MTDRTSSNESCGLVPRDPPRPPFLRGGAIRLLTLALLTTLTCTGCPEVAAVSVTIKPVAGGGSGAPDSDTEAAAAVAGYGNLVGTVTFDGSMPNLADLVAAGDASVKDATVCAVAAVPDESLVVNQANKGIANVVIFLEKKPAAIKPELAAPPTTPVTFDQKGCRFLPHLLTVRVGQPVLVVSDDGVPHNTKTLPVRNNAFNKVIAPNDRSGVNCDYTRAEPNPINVRCDYHPWMSAYHFPVDHPYVAVSDQDGKFKIEGLPAGKHAISVWQERGKFLERKLAITIEVDKDTTRDFTFGGNKFAARPAPGRALSYQRLLSGGEIAVSQTERQR